LEDCDGGVEFLCVGRVVDGVLCLSPSELQIFLAYVPRNVPVLVRGVPGIGKTSSLREFARVEAEALDRELIDLSYFGREREVLFDLLREVFKSPEKFYVLTYLKGWDITRETYAIPLSAVVRLDELIRDPMLSSVQAWSIPPGVYALTLPASRLEELRREHGDLYTTVLDYIDGVVPLANPNHVKILMRYFPLGMLIIDEALQAFPEFVNMYIMGLAGERHWAGLKLSPLVRIVFMYNPPEYNRAVTTPAEPFFRRVEVVEVVPPSADEFLNFVEDKFRELGRTVPRSLRLIVYSLEDKLKPSIDQVEKAVEKNLPYLTPASLFHFAIRVAPLLELYESNPSSDIIDEIVKLATAILGPDIAMEIGTILQTYVPTGAELLEDPDKWIETLDKYSDDLPRQEYARQKMIQNVITHITSSPEKIYEKVEKFAILITKMHKTNTLKISEISDIVNALLREIQRKYGSEKLSQTIVKLQEALTKTDPELAKQLHLQTEQTQQKRTVKIRV